MNRIKLLITCLMFAIFSCGGAGCMNINNGGYGAVNMSMQGFANTFRQVYSDISWNAYRPNKKREMSNLLLRIVERWNYIERASHRELVPGITVEDSFGKLLHRRRYTTDMKEILTLYISRVFRNVNAASVLCNEYRDLIGYVRN